MMLIKALYDVLMSDDDAFYDHLMMQNDPGGHPSHHQDQVPQDCQARKDTKDTDVKKSVNMGV